MWLKRRLFDFRKYKAPKLRGYSVYLRLLLHNLSMTILDKRFFFCLWLFLTLALRTSAQDAISISREGFPYCEPFTGTLDQTRGETILGGEVGKLGAYLTNQPNGQGALRLTEASGNTDQGNVGYAYIDIPFSSKYGVKVSFEYFSYGSTSNVGADGISFFMFDGRYGNVTGPWQFRPGGLGGSLSYAPYQRQCVDPGSGATPAQIESYQRCLANNNPGLTGGYIGVSLDEYGNFATNTEGRVTGIEDYEPNLDAPPMPTPAEQNAGQWLRPHSILVRGPHNASPIPYPYLRSLHKYTNYSSPACTLCVEPGEEFTLDVTSNQRVESCDQVGYRKVFLNLEPNGSGYLLSMYMLVNTDGNERIVQIFDQEPYNYAGFETLKLGFAASIGGANNIHEIKNVVAEVSEINDALRPRTEDKNFRICEDEADMTIQFPIVNLNDRADNFIRCLQLYEHESEIPTPGSSNPWPPTTDSGCGFGDGPCYGICDPENYEVTTSGGTFKSNLGELTDANRDEVKIDFTPTEGFVGETTIWYTVTDRYGLVSEPKKITVTILPNPELVSAEVQNPTCDGQNDGSIELVVSNLYDGYDYWWHALEGGVLGQVGTVEDLGGNERRFILPNVNIDTYTLYVANPSDHGGTCQLEIYREVIGQEMGTPLDVEVASDSFCEGEPAIITAKVQDLYNPNPNDIQASFLWYTAEDRVGGALQSGATVDIDGSQATVTVGADGSLSLEGLQADGTSPKTYTLYVEAERQTNPGGNFCPFLDEPQSVTITVFPSIEVTLQTEGDWCLDGRGRVETDDLGVSGQKTFTIKDQNGTVVDERTVVQYNYDQLAIGDYTLEVRHPQVCFFPEEFSIVGPDDPISISEIIRVPASCGLDNGSWIFIVEGGNDPYDTNSISVTGGPVGDITYDDSSEEFTLTGLASETNYTVTVTDQQSCTLVYSLPGTPDTDPRFEVEGDEICEAVPGGGGLETATVRPVVIELAGSSPIYKWYYLDEDGDEIALEDGDEIVGAEVSVSSDGEASFTGLPASDTAYVFLLEITDEDGKICDGPKLRAEVQVNAMPAPIFKLEDVSCYEGNDGSIRLDSGGSNDFIYTLLSTGESNSSGIFTELVAGDYSIRVDNGASGCWEEFSMTIFQPDSLLTIQSFDVLKASCGLPNGIIQNLTVTGGVEPYTIEWLEGGVSGTPLTQGSDRGLEDIFPGTYTMMVTDAGGCVEILEIEVGSMPDPEYQVAQVLAECEGEEVVLIPVHLAPDPNDPPASTEVFWYKNPDRDGLIETGQDEDEPTVSYEVDDSVWINPRLTIKGLAPGVYTYYFYVACTDEEIPVELTIAPIPDPEFDQRVETCAGAADGKIQVLSQGSDAWEFSINGRGFVSKAALESQNFGPGVYEILTRSQYGCEAELKVVEILGTASLDLQVIDTKNAACGVDDGLITVSMEGGWPEYVVILTRLGSGAETTIQTTDTQYTFDGLVAGSYELQVTDAEGCVVDLDTPVEILDGPTEILVDNLVEICEGEQIRVSPDINPPAADKTFRWFFGTTASGEEILDGTQRGAASYQVGSDGTLIVSGLLESNSPLMYSVRVEGPDICEGDIQVVEVRIYADPVFTAMAEDEICFGEGGAIVLNSAVGASNIQFSVNGGVYQAYPANRIENLEPGVYRLSAIHASGCEYILPQTVEIIGPQAPLELVSLNVIDASCSQDNGLIHGVLSGGWQPYSITVETSQGQSVAAQITWIGDSFEISGFGRGDYILRINDDSGCELATEVLSIVDAPTPVLADDVEICVGDDALLSPSVPNPTLSPRFTWYRDKNGTDVIQNGTFDGAAYSIAPDGQLTISGLPASDTPLEVYVGAAGEGICGSELKEVKVRVTGLPNLRTSNPSIICDPRQTVDLTLFIDGFNSDTYDYYVRNPSGGNMRLEEVKAISVSGTYNVQMGFKGSSCLTPSERILVVISETELVASFDYQIEIDDGNISMNQDINIGEDVEFIDTSQGDAVLWSWDFGDGDFSSDQNPVHAYEKKGSYTIKLTTLDRNGCESEFQRVVEVSDDFLVIVPDAFTPDRSDGKNNLFSPKFRGLAQIELLIFNTWGNFIFSSDSMENIGWDGKFNGKDVPNGNYVYRVNYTSRGGQKGTQTGVFILIR
ncbi:PKD domain-containing protein [Algoriphagus sp. NG3]|uniref:PKD domain-containing protein n=1 Tax=Algoriphagus sp. NG3 TaxID=3097546 RepID=UPI002A802458|nr:PKD domain-containing protein [Algoriphagus sp. NG3]WPR77802.1 gliding motility-associated C-terminal domain-containing protein [Algoriphagus sp. NG3]